MLSDTFNQNIQALLTLRSKFNNYDILLIEDEKYNLRHKKWISRYPYVFAYSNVRYLGDTTYKDLSVLSSSPLLMIDIKDQNNTIGLLYYGYVLDLQQGIISRPVIKSLNVLGRGASNNTVRLITMLILCFSYQQVFDVRDFFGIPTTSIFLQYGNFVDLLLFKSTFILPLMIDDLDFLGTDTYLDLNFLNRRYKDAVNMDYIFGVVSGFLYSQLAYNRYTLTVKMMSKGLTFLLRYVDINKVDYGSGSTKDIGKLLDSYIHDSIMIENNLIVTLTNLPNLKYVTLNWVANVIFPLLRYMSLGKSKQVPILYLNPIVKFNIQAGLDIKLQSNDRDILFIYDMNSPYRTIHQSSFGKIEDVQRIYMNYQSTIIKDSMLLRGYLAESAPLINIDTNQYVREFNAIYLKTISLYNKYAALSGLDIFSWFGNTYIRYQYIKDFFKDKDRIRVTQLLDNIQLKMKNALGGFLEFSSSYNFRYGILDFDLISKNIMHLLPYLIVNFGGGSVAKDTTIDIKMPDGVQKAIFLLNDQLDEQIALLFSNRAGQRPKDILQLQKFDTRLLKLDLDKLKRTERLKKLSLLKDKKIKLLNLMGEAYKKTKYTDGEFKLINTKSFNLESVKNSITYMNRKKDLDFRNRQLLQKKINDLTGVYHILITLDLDFIANILYGSVFTVTFNPFGWNSKFAVIDIKQTLSNSGAQTSITGRMVS